MAYFEACLIKIEPTMITKKIAHVLQGLQSPGDFYATGKMEIFPPRIHVNKVGRVALPLLPMQIKQLIEASERAPYGKGYDTVVDTDVRRTWQIHADDVTIEGKYWKKNLADIVTQVKEKLGVDCQISAELYKLLVYDKGSFFLSHRDTEKVEGMFATLIIVLPSEYSGGELCVKHQDKEVTLDLGSHDSEEISFAAFYADCVHEVLPIIEGCRLTLVYNLVRTHQKIPLPTPPSYAKPQIDMVALLNRWQQYLTEKTDADNNIPEKLIYLLEHEYSIAELTFDALKNQDAASAKVLIEAAKKAECNIYLALISAEESGAAEYSGGYSRYGYDDEEFEIIEVYEHSETISEWRSPDGDKSNLPTLPFYENEFCPPEAFESIEMGEAEFQEATGNAGASFDRMYHGAALVLWPRTHYLNIMNQAGVKSALLVLKDLCQQWKDTLDEKIKEDALTLASYILRDWIPAESEGRYNTGCNVADFLHCLNRLGEASLINDCWLVISKAGVGEEEWRVQLVKSSTFLPWQAVVHYVAEIIAENVTKNQESCILLLKALCNQYKESHLLQDFSSSAEIILTMLPGDSQRFPDQPMWRRRDMTLSVDGVMNALVCFSLINQEIAEKTLDYMLAWSDFYDRDEILLTATLKLIQVEETRQLPVIKRLQQTCITHLEARLAIALTPPTNWSRAIATKYSSYYRDKKDVEALNEFMSHVDQEQWVLKAPVDRRSVIEDIIKSNQLDIDCQTQKTHRPYSLVCTKNSASFQRKVDQSVKDQRTLGLLLIL